MAIIVAVDDKGRPQYRAASGLSITAEERLRADRLNELLKTSFAEFLRVMRRRKLFKEGSKGGGDLYWELGRVIGDIERSSKLVDRREHDMFLLNCKMHLPAEIVKSDRDQGRRDHLGYCLRLAKYSKEQMRVMNWGEWSYLFDSTNDGRFDSWLMGRIVADTPEFKRESIRTFRQVVTALLGNVETQHLNDAELFHSYDAAWALRGLLLKEGGILDKQTIKDVVRETKSDFAAVMSGTLKPEDYAAKLAAALLPGADQ